MISFYRGFLFCENRDSGWSILRGQQSVTECATGWGCVVYIDELLSP